MGHAAKKAPEIMDDTALKNEILDFAKAYFPIYRSITGQGLRKSLQLIQQYVPDLQIHEVPTGTQCFDWTVPPEWNITDAYIITPDGNKICAFNDNNLHVVGYSHPIESELSLSELQKHLHSLENQPEAIPYITSYYGKNWGFCISHNERQKLKEGQYKVFIDATFNPNGSMTYGELLIPGKSKEEIFFSTNICHPAMANNETSGPTVMTFLAQYIQSLSQHDYTYRILFIPETIGAIAYLSQHIDTLKKHVIAGFNVSCVGDERVYSYLHSREENTMADQVLTHILHHTDPDFIRYSYLERGSDERQYCSPGVDLPVVGFMRSKYGEFPEYHTSLDNFEVVTGNGLLTSLNVLKNVVNALENNKTYTTKTLCEPQLGKRGLYPQISTKQTKSIVYNTVNVLVYADGKRSLIEIADKIKCPIWELYQIIEDLKKANLIDET